MSDQPRKHLLASAWGWVYAAALIVGINAAVDLDSPFVRGLVVTVCVGTAFIAGAERERGVR